MEPAVAQSVDRPNEFNLIFTDQIPGYEAPSEGESFQAAMDVNAPFLEAVVEALTGQRGAVSIDDLTTEEQVVAYALRSTMHGFTILEVSHHAPYTGGPTISWSTRCRCCSPVLGLSGRSDRGLSRLACSIASSGTDQRLRQNVSSPGIAAA